MGLKIKMLLIFALLIQTNVTGKSVESTTLKVGLTGKYPPFNYIGNDGKLTGFDVEVAKYICKEIKRNCDFVILQWDGIVGALLAHRIDTIIGSMAVTKERESRVIFSSPYYESGAQLFIAPKAPSPRSENFRLGVTLGTTYGNFAKKHFEKAELRTFKGDIEVLQDIRNGQLDGILTDKLVGLHLAKMTATSLRTEGPLLYTEQMAIPVHPDNTALAAQINLAIAKLRASPDYTDLFRKYFGTAAKLDNRHMDWQTAIPLLLGALWETIKISFSGILLGFFIAALVTAILIVGAAPLKAVLSLIVDFIRSTPFMVQLFVLYFGLPTLGLALTPWLAALIAIAIHSAAYLTEIFKVAHQSIPKAQHQAARVLGLSRPQAFRHVILPQMVPIVSPSALNTVVAMIKDSAIISVISVHELTMQAQQLISTSFEPMKYYLVAAFLYAVVTYPLLVFGRHLEKSFRKRGLLHG